MPVVECAEPQADEVPVIGELVVVKALCGSREISATAGTRASSGATAPCGGCQAGCSNGAPAAAFGCAGGTCSGSPGGASKATGRWVGAYSGPSVQFAMGS